MLISRVARRYALAIYDSAVDSGVVDRLIRDAREIRATIRGSRELQVLFFSPIVSEEKKSSVLSELFREEVSSYTLGALLFLVEKRRESLTLQVLEAVEEIHHRRRGIQRVAFISAREVSETQKTGMMEKLARLTGKEIIPEYSIDPALIGGIVVRIGDKVYDGSVIRQLERLRHRFAAG